MKDLTKGLIIGVIIGIAVGAPVAWAAARATLQNGQGVEIGTASNPLYIQSI
jgi:type III secretory pathway component EscT